MKTSVELIYYVISSIMITLSAIVSIIALYASNRSLKKQLKQSNESLLKQLKQNSDLQIKLHTDLHGAMKIVVLATILFLSASPNCFAQATGVDDMLYVYTKNNKDAALYQLDDLNKITFSNSGVRMWNTNWPTEYPYSKVSVITFRDRNYVKPTSIETTYADEEQIRISYSPSSGVVTVKSSSLLDGIAVYDLQGRLVDSDHTSRQFYHLSLKHVHPGVYVVKAKGKRSETVKKIVKH